VRGENGPDGSTAETFGNITMEREALTLNNLAMAMAAKNSRRRHQRQPIMKRSNRKEGPSALSRRCPICSS